MGVDKKEVDGLRIISKYSALEELAVAEESGTVLEDPSMEDTDITLEEPVLEVPGIATEDIRAGADEKKTDGLGTAAEVSELENSAAKVPTAKDLIVENLVRKDLVVEDQAVDKDPSIRNHPRRLVTKRERLAIWAASLLFL